LGKIILWASPVPFVTHLIGFLLIRNDWPHGVALCATLASIATLLPNFLWASFSRKQRLSGATLRDFWSNRIGALLGIALLPLLGYLLSSQDHPWEPLTTFPLWSLLSGVTIFGMGSSFSGRFYMFGLLLIGLAFVMAIDLE